MHNLENRNGRYSMAYRASNGAPWHGFGRPVGDCPTLPEMLTEAQQDYTVALRQVYQRQFDGIFVPVDGKQVVYRTDTEDALGVVGDKYTPIQNREAFSWLEAFEGLTYDTAGVLGRGERAWIMACFEAGNFRIAGDVIRNNLLITTTHDGTGAMAVALTPTRVVCENTLTFGLRQAARMVKIRHTRSWADKLAQCEQVMELNRKHSDSLVKACERLALRRLSPDEAIKAFQTLVPEDSTRAQNVRVELLDLFNYGLGNSGETAWDWLNAVTEYADHTRTVRGANKAEQRFKSSVLEGSAVQFKQRAFDLITAA